MVCGLSNAHFRLEISLILRSRRGRAFDLLGRVLISFLPPFFLLVIIIKLWCIIFFMFFFRFYFQIIIINKTIIIFIIIFIIFVPMINRFLRTFIPKHNCINYTRNKAHHVRFPRYIFIRIKVRQCTPNNTAIKE